MPHVPRISSKFFISNIPWTIGSLELRQYFASFGPVFQAKVIYDKETGISKGFGFVSFQSPETADKVQAIPMHVLEGQSLVIQPTK